MKRYWILLLLTILFFVLDVNIPNCHAESLYDYYVHLAHEALDAKDYQAAYYYFDTAHAVDPDEKEPLYYLNLTKRLEDNRVENISSPVTRRTIVSVSPIIVKSSISQRQEKTKQGEEKQESRAAEKRSLVEISVKKREQAKREKFTDTESLLIKANVLEPQKENVLDAAKGEGLFSNEQKKQIQALNQDVINKKREKQNLVASKNDEPSQQGIIKTIKSETVKESSSREKKAMGDEPQRKEAVLQAKIELDDELLALQPKSEIKIELEKFIILKGKDITRFLVLTEDFFTVERLDKDTLKITPKRIGSTIMHIWDQKGRWTFTIRSIIPLKFNIAQREIKENQREEYVDPFKFSYSNNWGASYSGDSLSTMKRTSLQYRQNLSLDGDTPYGELYGFAGFTMFGDTTDLVNQGVGLTDGKIGPFKDFSIRGWDITKGFSSLSLPGRSIRGAMFETYAFSRKIQYTLLRGSDRARFEVISPGTSNIKKSYLEGGCVTYFHDENNEYSANYARGWGEERPSTLKDKVFSLEAKNKVKGVTVHSEIGYDENAIAKLIRTTYAKDNYSLKLNVRDIEKDYKTISSNPSGSGEVGGELRFLWSKDKTNVSSVAEIYRDREYFNPENPNGVNFNFSTTLYKPLSERLTWDSSFYYIDTPQLISSTRNVRLSNRLTRSFRFLKNHPFSLFVGNSYTNSRYKYAKSSEYDRYELKGGLNVRLIKNLSYYLNYTYSWVEDIAAKEINTPRVMNTGLNYSRRLGKKMSGNVSFTYRNEENTEGNFSFLSGADSIRGSIGLSYRPRNDVEIFLDASSRNIWSESADQIAYNEAEVRMGLTSSFDTLFRWNPSCLVKGVVYRDLNADKKKDSNEPPLEGIKIRVGKKEVLTNEKGEYQAKIKAKKAKVSIDPDSIPAGFVFSSAATQEFEIVHGAEEIINFGLTTHSGIYGVVYVDKNDNGQLDANDFFLPGAKIILDDRMSSYSNSVGAYFFNDISQGRHTLKIDINSLALEYIPLVKVKNEINVKEGTTYTLNFPCKVKE